MPTELYASPEEISLKTGVEVMGVYKELQKDGNQINLVIELANRRKVQVSFPKESAEAENIQKALRCVKHGVKIKIIKQNDSEKSIHIEKIPNRKSKEWTIYVGSHDFKRLFPFIEPGKKLSTAVTKILEIIENKQLIIVGVTKTKLCCNQMQNIGQKNRFYCANLGATTCEAFCREKCVAANQIKKILARGEGF
jgi:hypothetical protein